MEMVIWDSAMSMEDMDGRYSDDAKCLRHVKL